MNYNNILNKVIHKHNKIFLNETEAYHGSPYDFDEFDVQFMGKGEGAQAHGWGLYFSLEPNVAENYNKRLADKQFIEYHNKIYSKNSIAYIVFNYIDNKEPDKAKKFLNNLKDDKKFIQNNPKYLKYADILINKIDNINPSEIKRRGGQIYKVELPDLKYFLNEDEPFKKQSDFVQEKIREIYEENDELSTEYLNRNGYDGYSIYQAIKKFASDWSGEEASKLLLSKGIVGIKYNGNIDGNCVVMFSGKNIKIIDKYNKSQKSINAEGTLGFDMDLIEKFLKANDFEKEYTYDKNNDGNISKVNCSLKLLNLRDGYDDRYRSTSRDNISFETFINIITYDNSFFWDNDYGSYAEIANSNTSEFDKVLKENNIPLTFYKILQNVFENDDSPYKLAFEDFDGQGSDIHSTYNAAVAMGSESEAAYSCWKQLIDWYPFIQQGLNEHDCFKCSIDMDDIREWFKYSESTNDEDSENYGIDEYFWNYYNNKNHNGYDDYFVASEPHYGWYGFDYDYWNTSCEMAAQEVVKIYNQLSNQNMTQTLSNEHNTAIAETLRLAGIELEENEEPLEEMAYPTNFNLQEFSQLPTVVARKKYCDERLQKLGAGTSRIAYRVDDEKVLKIARNKKGIGQNEAECDWGRNNYEVFAKIFEADTNNYTWVEMEIARKAKKSDFDNLIGISFEDLCDIIAFMYNQYAKRGKKEVYMYNTRNDVQYMMEDYVYNESNPFLVNLYRYMCDYQPSVIGDWSRLVNWGIVTRNGQEMPVIIDAGLTEDVYNKYYRRG